jgi:hypothetical protein
MMLTDFTAFEGIPVTFEAHQMPVLLPNPAPPQATTTQLAVHAASPAGGVITLILTTFVIPIIDI